MALCRQRLAFVPRAGAGGGGCGGVRDAAKSEYRGGWRARAREPGEKKRTNELGTAKKRGQRGHASRSCDVEGVRRERNGSWYSRLLNGVYAEVWRLGYNYDIHILALLALSYQPFHRGVILGGHCFGFCNYSFLPDEIILSEKSFTLAPNRCFLNGRR